jgi:hypothetical protein
MEGLAREWSSDHKSFLICGKQEKILFSICLLPHKRCGKVGVIKLR